ncbi:MAG: hypothetical protein PWR07_981 [Bacillota bacterium]|nr:hypothetical protein [Bacillota bacterium]
MALGPFAACENGTYEFRRPGCPAGAAPGRPRPRGAAFAMRQPLEAGFAAVRAGLAVPGLQRQRLPKKGLRSLTSYVAAMPAGAPAGAG